MSRAPPGTSSRRLGRSGDVIEILLFSYFSFLSHSVSSFPILDVILLLFWSILLARPPVYNKTPIYQIHVNLKKFSNFLRVRTQYTRRHMRVPSVDTIGRGFTQGERRGRPVLGNAPMIPICLPTLRERINEGCWLIEKPQIGPRFKIIFALMDK